MSTCTWTIAGGIKTRTDDRACRPTVETRSATLPGRKWCRPGDGPIKRPPGRDIIPRHMRLRPRDLSRGDGPLAVGFVSSGGPMPIGGRVGFVWSRSLIWTGSGEWVRFSPALRFVLTGRLGSCFPVLGFVWPRRFGDRDGDWVRFSGLWKSASDVSQGWIVVGDRPRLGSFGPAGRGGPGSSREDPGGRTPGGRDPGDGRRGWPLTVVAARAILDGRNSLAVPIVGRSHRARKNSER